jgi:hypothetical protein
LLSQRPSPQNADDLGKFKACFSAKPWHVHGNAMPSTGGFYPNLAKVDVGKDIIEGEGTLGFEASLASMTS